MKEISPEELKTMIENGDELQIIDIRETHEVESGNLGGLHIPMAEVMNRLDEIRKDCPVIIHCKSGKRAKPMVYALTNDKGFSNVYHLEGGLENWAVKVNPEIVVY